ncbi:MAG: asparagine synthase (glutamine-hydrolyzing) [Acidobacteriaceae bacterium]|nr:asparagine synthase (glutamine-hydrolyzing) [Acidobacteriaceae bacterium]
MCGIAGVFGERVAPSRLLAMVDSQRHRGPDSQAIYLDPSGVCGLGHNRLSILDLSPAGNQPMSDESGSLWIAFNGEIYNYIELRAQLSEYRFRTRTDTEVVLAAYRKWGKACVDRFLGMFAFLLWDARERTLFAARDRFGVKPLYYHRTKSGDLVAASEIRALHRGGIAPDPDVRSWSTYLTYGLHDHSERTFWSDIQALPAGHALTWKPGHFEVRPWYDVADRIGPEFDARPDEAVEAEYSALLEESIRLRFRSEVPVGINISGGLDSSTLLGLVRSFQGAADNVQAFTYVTGDPDYDELPWVEKALKKTHHRLVIARLSADEVPELAASVEEHESEPFGGIPTLAYAKVFEAARERGVTVLLDGQGMDEQWAGYDYYERLAQGQGHGPVQGSRNRAVRPECLSAEFRKRAVDTEFAAPFPDGLRNRQYQDIRYTKIPRALRFNDRISMRCSTELREPFMDHRLFELALLQPAHRKLRAGQRKYLLRRITSRLLPEAIVEAPKRPVQTPQREWLRGRLRDWAEAHIHLALKRYAGEWLDRENVKRAWREYETGGDDNSFYIWQWISLGLATRSAAGLKTANDLFRLGSQDRALDREIGGSVRPNTSRVSTFAIATDR